jgi:hypothetical protein
MYIPDTYSIPAHLQGQPPLNYNIYRGQLYTRYQNEPYTYDVYAALLKSNARKELLKQLEGLSVYVVRDVSDLSKVYVWSADQKVDIGMVIAERRFPVNITRRPQY